MAQLKPGTTIGGRNIVQELDSQRAALEAHLADFEAHLAEIAPHAELMDRTIAVGVGKDFPTIQAAINSLKKRIDAIITINVDAGIYSEEILVQGFIGGNGQLIINGANSLEDAANYKINSIELIGNRISVTLKGFDVTEASGRQAIYCHNSSHCILQYITTLGSTSYGVACSVSYVYISDCISSNHNVGIQADNGAIVFSQNNAGENNTYGLLASQGAVIAKSGTQPAGTTAELIIRGGEIR